MTSPSTTIAISRALHERLKDIRTRMCIARELPPDLLARIAKEGPGMSLSLVVEMMADVFDGLLSSRGVDELQQLEVAVVGTATTPWVLERVTPPPEKRLKRVHKDAANVTIDGVASTADAYVWHGDDAVDRVNRGDAPDVQMKPMGVEAQPSGDGQKSCVWCDGTGFIRETGIMCRKCGGTGVVKRTARRDEFYKMVDDVGQLPTSVLATSKPVGETLHRPADTLTPEQADAYVDQLATEMRARPDAPKPVAGRKKTTGT